MGTFASVSQLKQNRVGQWLGCVMAGLQRRGIIWHEKWIMASAPLLSNRRLEIATAHLQRQACISSQEGIVQLEK
jgi:hypothetical protein